MAARSVLAALALGIAAAGCARSTYQEQSSPSRVAAMDSWLRERSASDCPRSACLFAVIVDSAGNPIPNAIVELTGSTVHATSTGQGRIIAQSIPMGSHRVRVTHGGETLESEPIAFGYTIRTLVMEVSPGNLRIRT